uniref:Glutaredoxin domain-containing protein n=1 Tax=Pyramimonas orientalis virus TaxID=455367 RepID=A0A7M3UNZ7_POV01|nr:hypothetical protein HWQ62_00310 [Pyramimonas orientalis virus]
MSIVFFYSEQCNHCKDAYDLIKKVGVDKFIFKDVEKESSLPDGIDRVPSILTKEMNVHTEDNLFRYLLELMNIEPFMVNEMGKTLSDTYSYIDDSGVKLDHSFQFLDKDVKINTPSESDNNKIINYDKFIAERDNDLKIISDKDV